MASDTHKYTEKILSLLKANPDGLSTRQIYEKIEYTESYKSLQRLLVRFSDDGLILKTGENRARRYLPLGVSKNSGIGQILDRDSSVFSPKSRESLRFLANPPHIRKRVSYNRDFLDSYVPNQTAYVAQRLRKQMHTAGKRFDRSLAAGTYAREISQRLLIDLSYNSSRLEGNTYSRLDTQNLLEHGAAAEGKVDEESVMIVNHKEAILFLIENVQDIDLNSLTIRNVHHLLSQDLLANPEASGNIRTCEVHIGRSTYQPLSNPHLLGELLELLLLKARKIDDPFEQSFFALVHLSYLQAFEDVNKRTSRLCCNIPFFKENLCPLSFTDVSREDYTAALLAIYEQNNIEPMVELFVWAYLRSCEQYGVVKRSLGEIDAFRVQFRKQRKEVMGLVVQNMLHGAEAEGFIERYCQQNGIAQVERFTAIALSDLRILHAAAIVGLGVTEAQLNAWLAAKGISNGDGE